LHQLKRKRKHMKSANINLKSLQHVTNFFSKKLKQWKHYLQIINLVLLIGTSALAIICVLLIYLPPESTVKKEKHVDNISINRNLLTPIAKDAESIDQYESILSSNPFSPARTAWAPQTSVETKTAKEEPPPATKPADEQKPKEPPKKINLRGIMIIGDIKKALIENPDTSKNKNQFIFIEEGEDIVGYKVKNIEPDQIILDWYGEEQIIAMRSNIKK
jgi:hypothetical protein